MKQGKRFIGIRRQLVLRISALVVVILLLFWLFNTLFMSYFYREEKVDAMEDVFEELDGASVSGELYESSFDSKFEQISLNNNLDIVVMSYDGSVLLSSGKEKSNTIRRMLDAVLSNTDGNKSIVHTSMYDIIYNKDLFVNEEYLVLTGTLSDGKLVMLRYAIENMKFSLDVINKTTFVVALISVILSLLLSEMVARRITKPVVELTNISKRMSELDFYAKYKVRDTASEIDILGEHMNTMSSSLENALEQLQEANEELKKDIESKERNEQMRQEFLSNVSHELKTPISLIQGYAEGLNEGMAEDSESRAYYCEVIVDEAKKMNKMVQQLMSLNELEYGHINVDKTKFNITELIRNLVTSSKILMEHDHIRLTYEIGDDVYINSDEYLVEEIFSNFLSNAIHHTEGDREIKISQLEKVDSVRISVFNSGKRIPEDEIDRIWDKFYKVDKARTREYGGSGVGLSIVKAAVEALDGKFGVYNKDNGVVFWFEIYK